MSSFYKRPTRFRIWFYDPLVRMLIRRTGFGGNMHRVLAVRGRRSGAWYYRPLSVCTLGDERYIVSFYGESEWARNLRAGAEAQLGNRGLIEPIRVRELAGNEKAEFLRRLVQRHRSISRLWLKVNPSNLTERDIDRLVDRFPVFRIEHGQLAGESVR